MVNKEVNLEQTKVLPQTEKEEPGAWYRGTLKFKPTMGVFSRISKNITNKSNYKELNYIPPIKEKSEENRQDTRIKQKENRKSIVKYREYERPQYTLPPKEIHIGNDKEMIMKQGRERNIKARGNKEYSHCPHFPAFCTLTPLGLYAMAAEVSDTLKRIQAKPNYQQE